MSDRNRHAVRELNTVSSKDTKQFRFQSFSERIKKLNVDVFHRVGTFELAPEQESSSFFRESLDEWTDLDCTAQFSAFAAEVWPLTDSLALVLFNREKIVDALLRHIKIPNTPAVKALLSLTGTLARDLRHAFVPHFKDVLLTLCGLVDPKDPDGLEDIFTALGHLFKHLYKYLLPELPVLFDTYSRLISHPRQHVRHFAAESFAFLLRKLETPKLPEVLLALMAKATRPPAQHSLREGLSFLLFETVKGLKLRLHSRAQEVFNVILALLTPIDSSTTQAAAAEDDDDEDGDNVDEAKAEAAKAEREKHAQLREELNLPLCYGVVEATFRMILNHVRKGGSAEVLWQCLVKHANELVAPLGATSNEPKTPTSAGRKQKRKSTAAAPVVEVTPRHAAALIGVASLFETCASFRSGAMLPLKGENKDGDAVIASTEALCRPAVLGASDEVCQAVLQYVAALLRSEDYRPFFLLTQKRQEHFQRLLRSIFSLPSPSILIPLFKPIYKTRIFVTHLLPLLPQYCEEVAKAGQGHALLSLLSNLLAADSISTSERLPLPDQGAQGAFLAFLFSHLGGADASQKRRATTKEVWAQWVVVRLVPCLDLAAQPQLHAKFADALRGLLDRLSASSHTGLPTKRRFLLLNYIIASLAELTMNQDSAAVPDLVALWPKVQETLKIAPTNPLLLQGVQHFFSALIQARDTAKEEGKKGDWEAQVTQLLSWDSLRELLPVVAHNVAHPDSAVRRATLSILSHFTVPMPEDAPNLLVVMCEAEHVEPSVQTGREMTLLMRRVLRTAVSSVSSQIPKEIRKLVPHFFVGRLRLPFSMAWDAAVEALAELAGHNIDILWPILETNLTQAIAATVAAPEAGADDTAMEIDVDADEVEEEEEEDSDAEIAELDAAAEVESRTTDALTFCDLLFRTLCQVPAIVAKRSKDVVPLFFRFLWERYDRLFPPTVFPPNYPLMPAAVEVKQETETVDNETVDNDEEDDNEEDGEGEEEEGQAQKGKRRRRGPDERGGRKAARRILENFLKVFASISSRKIHEADKVKAAVIRLLARSETQTQRLAVECLAGWGEAHLNSYKETILKLIDEKSWRNEMTLFSLDEETGHIERRHRASLIPLLIPILCAKLLSGKGKSKENAEARRGAVFSYVGGLTDPELVLFLDFLLQPFLRSLAEVGDPCASALAGKTEEVEAAAACMARVPVSRQVGFLGVSRHIYKQLPHRIAPHVGRLFSLTLLLLANSYRMTKSRDGKEVRKLALKRVGDIMELVPAELAGGYQRETALLFHCISVDIANLPARCGQSSPILRCLVVLASQPTLAPLFGLHTAAVPQLIRCFSAPDLIPAVLVHLLTATESLLAYAPQLIAPHVELLLDQFVAAGLRNLWATLQRRKLSLLAGLAHMATTKHQSELLLKVLAPLLHDRAMKKIGREGLESVLGLYSAKAATVGRELALYLPAFSSLVATVPYRDTRLALFDVLRRTAAQAPELKIAEAVTWIEETSAYSTTEVGAFDYTRRQQAYKQFDEGQCDEWVLRSGVDAASLVANALLFSLADEDSAIREPASHALSRFLAVITQKGNEQLQHIGNKTILPLLNKYATGVHKYLRKHALQLLRDYAVITPDSAYADLVVLNTEVDKKAQMSEGLRQALESEDEAEEESKAPRTVKNINSISGEKESRRASKRDKDVNFFDDVFHVKRTRVLNALRMLQSPQILAQLKPATVDRVLIPFVFAEFVKSVQPDEFNKHQAQHVDGNIVNETAQSIAALSTRLTWGAYQGLLLRLLKTVGRKAHIASFVVKIVCTMLRRFPFSAVLQHATPDAADAMDVEAQKKEGEEKKNEDDKEEKKKNEDDKEEDDHEEEEEEEEAIDEAEAKRQEELDEAELTAKADRIRHALLHRIVPQLTRYLTDPSDPSRVVRPNVALAIVHVLGMFPQSLDLHLPPVITKVCQNMRSRLESVRETTREALRGMLSQLGVRFLGYVVRSLQVVLTKGFELHVLGHAVHDFLQHLAGHLKPGDLDYLVADIVPILVEHLLGDVAHQKDVDAIKRKTREARQQTLPYHAYQILAKATTFAKLPELIEPLREHLEYTFSLDEVKKITEILRHVAQGLSSNNSARPADVLIYAHSLLTQFLLPTHGDKKRKVEEKKQESVKERETRKREEEEQNKYLVADMPAPGGKLKRARREKDANTAVLAEFGLNLLLSVLRKRTMSAENPEHVSMLDPFLGMLVAPLRSLPDRSALLALKCVGGLVRMKTLPSAPTTIPVLIDNVLGLLRQGEVESKMGQACLKTVTQCLKFEAALTTVQLTTLLKIVETGLDELNDHPRTFALIKMILTRRLMAPEVYDLATRLSTLLVQHTASHIRSSCRHMIGMFLVHYPLGRKRMDQQLGFFVDNLGYVHESGRESSMEMLLYLFNKLPEDLLVEKAAYFFIPLVLRLVNDESPRLRAMAGALLTSLLRRLPDQPFQRLYSLTVGWYSNEDARQGDALILRRAAAQVLGLFLDARPQAFLKKKKMQKLVALLLAPLVRAAAATTNPDDATTSGGDADDDVSTAAGLLDEEGDMSASSAKWGVEYYSLRVLEKAFSLDSAMASGSADGLWEACEALLVADHAWVRTVSARLLGLHFATWQQNEAGLAALSQADADSAYLAKPGRLFQLARRQTWMLTAPSHLLPPALLTQLLKNLLFLSLALHANPGLVVMPERHGDEEEEEAEMEEEEAEEEEAEGEGEEGEQQKRKKKEKKELGGNPALHWLFRKIAYIARKPGNDERRGMALRWFAGMASRMGQDMRPYLIPTIGALYRIGSSKQKAEDAVRDTALEVTELVTRVVGNSAYYDAYSQVRSHVAQTRLSRKRQLAVQAVVNPEAMARKKQRKHKKDAERRKRKAEPFTRHKESTSIRSKKFRLDTDN